MESVVATVSGYHGTERFNLIKLISLAGANYVGNLSQSITHLVCWRFEGRKYEIAKKLNVKIVNHRWVEDCIKNVKRLPEDPYMLQSGEEMGPLLLKITDVDKGDGLTKKTKVFSDKTNVDYGDSGLSGWSKSALLDEVEKHGKSFSSSSMPPMRNKRKISKNKVPNTHSSAQLLREERDIPNCSRGTSLATSSQKKRRRLVKNVDREIVVSSDSDQECYPSLRVHKPSVDVKSPYDLSLNRSVSLCETGEPSCRDFSMHRRLRRVDEEVEEINSLSNQPPSNGLTSPRKDTQPVAERTSPDGCSDAERVSQDVASRPSTSTNISCVICHTEFSPTRGVLTCGHRFCYSCIQMWADNMTASRKKPLCPLCKTIFTSITKVEDAAVSDQKVFSQTIPCAISTLDVPILFDQERTGFGAQFSAASVCMECRSREPEELLISCHLCQIRNIHVYCLDPPLSPWTCIHCRDLARLNPYNIH